MSLKYFTSPILKTTHAFFSRKSGVSKGAFDSLNFSLKDNISNVMENKKIVLNEFSKFENLLILNQVHGGKVIYTDENIDLTKGDALITKSSKLLIGVITADCVPILLYDDKLGVISAIHAGWKGAVLESIVQNTLAELKNLGCSMSDICASIGPCIRHYEVKNDVANLVPDKFLKVYDDRYLFDIAGFVKNILENEGITKVHDTCLDTFLNEEMFFSCRRSFIKKEKGFGCQLSVIGLGKN